MTEADETELDQPWRTGEHYGVHVYQGNRPVATFFNALEAEIAVNARNNSTPVLITPQMIQDAAQAIRDSNGTPEAVEAWKRHPQLVPAHVYAEAVLANLFEQGYVIARPTASYPMTSTAEPSKCSKHNPVQHRDAKEPWCKNCGLTIDFRQPQSGRREQRPLRVLRRDEDGDRSIGAGKSYDDAGGFDRPT